MEFTWWTYQVAIHRCMKVERMLFFEHLRAFRGPEAWHEQYRFLNRLIARQVRERG
ncbi:MAG: hypothetical protein ACTHJM_16085 [Marmoricola sp.]